MTLHFAIKALGKAPRSDVIFPSCGSYRVVRKASEGSGEGWKALGTVRAKMSLEEAAVSPGEKHPGAISRGAEAAIPYIWGKTTSKQALRASGRFKLASPSFETK